ncbi:MAG: 3-mercaptopyruvate sulfurtransferase [Kiloniellales bacterium]
MAYVNPDALVSTDWLAEHLHSPDVRVVDATYFLLGMGRDARSEYEQRHIPGAVFFDIDEICDPDSRLPHMLPSAERFAGQVGRLGLGDGDRIVAYDAHGLVTAARAWWMFRVFGHDDVAVLDGGLPKWLQEGRPVDDVPPTPPERRFTPRFNASFVRNFNQMLQNINSTREQVIDTRPAGRFNATDPEPREGLRGGHIPGSVNVPFSELVDPATHTMLPTDALVDRFAKAGVDTDRPMVTTCGSGVTAALVALGLYLLGHEQVAVYDGSWSEWGARDEAPIER